MNTIDCYRSHHSSILDTLPQSNHLLLKALICVLYRISLNADTNGMNPFNIGLCVSNSLFKTESTSISSGKQEADVMSSIVEFLIVNCSLLFGSDVVTCIPDKRILIHPFVHRRMIKRTCSNIDRTLFVFIVIRSIVRPTASSTESLDEVESSPHVPVVNRSHDSGLATSDQPFNDDSSEISEHIRRQLPTIALPSPDWTGSISCGKGIVLTSVIASTQANHILTNSRIRNARTNYRPSRQFMEREKLTNDTTDDSDHGLVGDSSVRSSTTTVNNMSIGKMKRTKPVLRHSSLGNNEYHQQQQQHKQQQQQQQQDSQSHDVKCSMASNDVKRASSLKQFYHSSDDADAADERTKSHKMAVLSTSHYQTKKKGTSIGKDKIEPNLVSAGSNNSKQSTIERRSRLVKTKLSRTSDDESITTR
jgi:hypothetical protein